MKIWKLISWICPTPRVAISPMMPCAIPSKMGTFSPLTPSSIDANETSDFEYEVERIILNETEEVWNDSCEKQKLSYALIQVKPLKETVVFLLLSGEFENNQYTNFILDNEEELNLKMLDSARSNVKMTEAIKSSSEFRWKFGIKHAAETNNFTYYSAVGTTVTQKQREEVMRYEGLTDDDNFQIFTIAITALPPPVGLSTTPGQCISKEKKSTDS